MNNEQLERYKFMVEDCTQKFGSQRALARQLGIKHSTLTYRINHPSALKREHVYAIELIHTRVNR